MPNRREALAQLVDESRLPDARLAEDEHVLPVALLGLRPALDERRLRPRFATVAMRRRCLGRRDGAASTVIGVVFEGCACRAAFHAGVGAALADAGLEVGVVAGTSSGALCAAAFAAGRGGELPALWRRLGGRSVISYRRLLWNRSIFDMSHLVRSAIVDTLGIVDLRDRPTEALVVATRLRDWRPVVFSSHSEPALLEPLLGSCFLPPFYGRPICVRGDYFLDGGFSDNLPIEALGERRADDVIAVVVSHRGTALKSPLRPWWRPVLDGRRVHVVHPERALEIGSWDLSADRMNRAIDEGYRCGRIVAGR